MVLRGDSVVRDYTGVGRRTGRRALITIVLVLLCAHSVSAQLPGLARLRLVDVSVDVEHPLDFMTPEDLAARVQERLNRGESSIVVSERSTDRIRLTVAVRPTSASTLRGFWLPFSGIYAVGAMRLGVERMVTLPGPSPRAFPALVWQTERIVGVPWHATEREVMRLLDEMVAELLDARRQAG
jgi:hypothetical protein